MTTVSNLQLQSLKHLWDLNEEASSYLQQYDEEKWLCVCVCVCSGLAEGFDHMP